MRLPLFQVDVFTSRRFGGNPAAVAMAGRVVEYLRGEIEV
jgi:predicted PhzF superfamily epimerase YddE/YHI9